MRSSDLRRGCQIRRMVWGCKKALQVPRSRSEGVHWVRGFGPGGAQISCLNHYQSVTSSVGIAVAAACAGSGGEEPLMEEFHRNFSARRSCRPRGRINPRGILEVLEAKVRKRISSLEGMFG